MKGVNNSNLNVSAVLLIAGILLILYFLKIIINNQEKLLKKLSNSENVSRINSEVLPNKTLNKPLISKDKGITKGDTKIGNVDTDEIIAVIMAAVSNASNIPLTSLKIRSIKKL